MLCSTCKEWKPRWGFKRIKDPNDDWMVEVPDNAGKLCFLKYIHLV